MKKDSRGGDNKKPIYLKEPLVTNHEKNGHCAETQYNTEAFTAIRSPFKEIGMEQRSDFLSTVLMITHEGIGDETNALSKNLMQTYLRALAEKSPYPQVIIFLNRGVLLSTNHSTCLDSLRLMESKGVLILSNCTCLEYHKVMDELAVGGVTSMYHIVELSKLAKNVMTL